MTQLEEDIKVLRQLGLTALQAQVYLTLSKLGKATIKTIATTARIDRANAYRVMSKLMKLNLVEKMITNPIVFKAVGVNEALQMLLERKAKEYQEIEAKAKDLVKNCQKISEAAILDECQFALIPDNKATFRKIGEMMDRSQKSYNLSFYWKALVPGIDDAVVFFKKVKEKGLNIRLIAHMHEGETLPEGILSLIEKGKFEVRFTFNCYPISLTLFDKKEALINTASFSPIGTPSLWSNNPVLVAILQDYFDRKWRYSNKISQ